MTSTGGWGVPGSGALTETIEREITWGGDRAKGMVLEMSANYSEDIVDTGNTVTTDIRAGLIVAKLSVGGELVEWDADGGLTAATLGEENIFGVCPLDFRTLDFNATKQDRVLSVIVRAPFKAASLLIEGVALVGHANEYLARRMLHDGGSILDDDPQGHLAGAGRRQKSTAADYTVVAAENGMTFVGHTADNEFTLPTIKAGLKYDFVQSANFELKVTSAEGDNIIVSAAEVAADSIVFTTTGEQIGAQLSFECMSVNGTLKWIFYQRITLFETDNFLAYTVNT